MITAAIVVLMPAGASPPLPSVVSALPRSTEAAVAIILNAAPPVTLTIVDSQGGSRVASVQPAGEAASDVRAAGLGHAALNSCLNVISTVRAIAPTASELAIPSEDGGMTIEFEAPGGREIVFAVPGDGSVRYFVARGPDGFRKAGVVVEGVGVAHLAEWLAERAPFNPSGLQVGERSAKHR